MNREKADMRRMRNLKSRRWRFGDGLFERLMGLPGAIESRDLSPFVNLGSIQTRSARWLLIAIAGAVVSLGVEAEGIPLSQAKLEHGQESTLLVDSAPATISVNEVIHSIRSMEGDYPVHTYGTYMGGFFWMDSHRLILSAQDKDRHAAAIESWDVDSGNTSRYGLGKIMCYADGLISKMSYLDGASPTTSGVLQKGL